MPLFLDKKPLATSSFAPSWTRRFRLALVVLVTAAFGMACNGPTMVTCDGRGARSGDACLGFSDLSSGPTVDASIGPDARWDQGFRYVFSRGTALKDGVVQGVSTSNTLYLSFEVHKDPQIQSTDRIELYFDPTGTDTERQKIVVTPFSNNQPPSSSASPPNQVDYYEGQSGGGFPTSPTSSSPSWLADNVRVRTTQSGPNQREWYVEMGIPISSSPSTTALHVPSNDDFGFYFILRNTAAGGTGPNTVEYNHWPEDSPLVGSFNDVPPVEDWGNGIIGKVANGVSISTSDISVSPGTASQISLNQTNTFTADVKNRMVDSQGSSVVANNVNATFRIANWGLPSQWQQIPSTSGANPTANQNIPAGTPGSRNFDVQWLLNASERSTYQADPHQCIRVELDADGPNTLITNRQAMRNMNFVNTSSPFKDQATVGTAGYRVPDGQRVHEFLLRVFTYGTPERASWETELESSAMVERLGEKLFQLRVRPEQEAALRKVITPPEVDIPRRVVTLGANPQERVRIDVEPGNIITFYAEGQLVLRPDADGPAAEPVGPAGRRVAELGDQREAGDQERAFLLHNQHAPESRAGALVGSFDGFDTISFPVGRGSTIQVPDGARELTLAVNDLQGLEESYGGDGYQIEVMQTPPEEYFAHADGRVLREELKEVLFLPLGINLPSWEVQGLRRTGRTVTLEDDRSYEVVENVGSYGYLIKEMGGN